MIFRRVLIALDQTLNCCVKLSDGWGYPDETLSARAYRLREQHPWLIRWIDRVFFWEKHHCQASYGSELARAHFPDEYRRAG